MARTRGKRITGDDGSVRIAGKAANGAGSVYLDASGTYRATYVDPTTGKRRTTSGRTKAEAAERRDAKLAELNAATPSGRLGPTPTVADLTAWWLDTVAAVTVRPSTLHTYRKDAARVTEHLGTLAVADLDTEAVRTYLATLRAAGLAASTCRNARTRLRQIAQAAVELGYLAHNPVVSVPAPKARAEERRRARSLSPDEVRRLLGALSPANPLDAAVALLFTSGIRVSEALGLAWSDLDLDAGTATIRRASTYTGGGVGARLDTPKTSTTAGVHHLAPTAVALLRARRAQQNTDRLAAGPAWEVVTYEGAPLDLVFTTTLGAPRVRQYVGKALQDACDRAGIDSTGIGTHTGRRSTVTALYVAGLSLDDVARHVGHASPSTTAGYVTDLGTRPEDTARLAAGLLDPASGTAT